MTLGEILTSIYNFSMILAIGILLITLYGGRFAGGKR